jgi:enamine deaminase RidA (YjgF/YER057c/UK114 family)
MSRRSIEILQPPGWPRPKGYSNGIAASGRLVFTAGIVGWDAEQRFAADDIVGQCAQIFRNTLAILAEAGASPEHIVRMTWYVTSRDEYAAAARDIGRVYREIIGRTFPAMAVVQVAALVEPEAKVEIETIAVVPAP